MGDCDAVELTDNVSDCEADADLLTLCVTDGVGEGLAMANKYPSGPCAGTYKLPSAPSATPPATECGVVEKLHFSVPVVPSSATTRPSKLPMYTVPSAPTAGLAQP